VFVRAAVKASLRRLFFPDRATLHWRPYVVVSAAALLVSAAVVSLSLTQRLEWALYDRMMSAATRRPVPPGDIVIVAIDEPSFSELGMQWPWPRRVHAALLESLVKGGARTIVLDLLFDEPSSEEDDGALADAIRAAGNVVLASDRATTSDRAYELEQWMEPLPVFAKAAAAVGAVSVEGDPDGVIRRMPWSIDGRPMLGVATALRNPGFVAAPDAGGSHLVHFLGAPRQGIVTVSYYQALEPGLLPAGFFRDKIVLVGRSLSAAAAIDQPDHFRTPVAVLMPGVEVHASQLDTVLRRREVREPFSGIGMSTAFALGAGVLAAVVFFWVAPHQGLLALTGAWLAFVAAAYVALAYASIRIPAIAPAVTATIVFGTTAAYRFALGQQERRLIRRAFQHYVSPAIVKQMLDDPLRLKLGGEAYELTVIFTDLEGFTSIAERLTPEMLRATLSVYFKAMMDVLLAERATLDKFIGDAIMVYFGCPVPDTAHPLQACRAALAMQRRLDVLNEEWRRNGTPVLHMRIGVNTGVAVAGNMGTDEIFNYTILGDCVNLASRLEGVNKAYGTSTILGADTWAHVQGHFETRELDWIRVKGKATPVAIYELIAEAGGLTADEQVVLERFASGLACYRARRWAEAETAFRSALDARPDDGPSRTFLARCARYAVSPPPEPWDGVYEMQTK
jgi:adenylate cyclase